MFIVFLIGDGDPAGSSNTKRKTWQLLPKGLRREGQPREWGSGGATVLTMPWKSTPAWNRSRSKAFPLVPQLGLGSRHHPLGC